MGVFNSSVVVVVVVVIVVVIVIFIFVIVVVVVVVVVGVVVIFVDPFSFSVMQEFSEFHLFLVSLERRMLFRTP